MRVFFDASIIFAALLSPSGGSSFLLEYVKTRKIIGITSQAVIEEILDEDKAKKLKRVKKEIENFIAKSGLIIRKEITTKDILPYEGKIDSEDAHLIAGAHRTKCGYLVTLDKKHLLRADLQSSFLPLRIVSPKTLLEEIVGR